MYPVTEPIFEIMSNLIKNKNGVFVLPGIVSIFIPGLGQLIKGHVKKGVAFLALWGAFWIISWIIGWIPLIGPLLSGIGIIALIINVIDAFISKKDINKLPIKS